MTLHPNTLTAYASTATERSSLESRILGLMADGKARTDREIATELDILNSQYRARIHYLVTESSLHEVGSKPCEVTEKKVRLTKRFL